MNFLNYSLTAIVCYLGLFVGFALAIIAKEELKAGKRYFIVLQKIILLLVFVFLLIFIDLDYILILLILFFITVYTVKYFKKEFNEIFYIYVILSIVFYLSSKVLNLFTIESFLIFLYGLPSGSLLSGKNKKESSVNIIKNIDFVLVAIILFLIF